MVVFTILMHNIPEYAQTIEKVKAASGFPMSDMIYLVCPAAFLLSVISKTLYHATSEPWRVAGSGLKIGYWLWLTVDYIKEAFFI